MRRNTKAAAPAPEEQSTVRTVIEQPPVETSAAEHSDKPGGNKHADALAVLNRFMEAWKAGDWKGMARACTVTWKADGHPGYTSSGWMRTWYGRQPNPERWEISMIVDVGEHAVDMNVTISHAGGTKTTRHVRIIREGNPYAPSPDGTWGVNPVSALWTA